MNAGTLFFRCGPLTIARRLASCLLVAAALTGCASGPAAERNNESLRLAIHADVPPSWRAAADSSPDIDPLHITPRLREFIHSRAQSGDPPRTRMLSLANAVFDPDGVNLVYDDAATHTAAQTFESGLGNCMGFSNLLVAAAREAGLNTHFELVSNFQNWEQQGDLLLRTQHVRVVSLIHQQKMVFDFFPRPVDPGSWSRVLSDTDARAHHFNNLAAIEMQEGDNARAYGYLQKALGTSPGIGFVWSNLGALLSRQGLNEEAEAAYGEAMRLEPELLTAVSNLQRLYERTGRAEEAAALSGQVRRYRERNPYFHFWLAEQAYEEGRYAEAVTHYREAIKRKKNERDFYVGLSRSYYKLGKKLAARKAISKSHKIFTPAADTVLVRPARR